MKKLIVFAALSLSQPVLAGDDFQMVLDKVHEQGFNGCDKAMSSLLSLTGIQRVEARLINERLVKIDDRGNVAVQNVPDRNNANQVRVDIATVGDTYSSIYSYSIQKMNGKCFAAFLGNATNYSDKSCEQILAVNSSITVDRTGAFVWSKGQYSKRESDSILVKQAGGGCTIVGRAGGWASSGLGYDMDQAK